MIKATLNKTRAALAAVAVLAGGTAGAEIVYNNSTNYVMRFDPGLAEVGDEIILDGTARTVTTFVFEYWGVNLSGATAQLRFYANDGTNAPAGLDIFVPETLLFESDPFAISDTTGATLVFDETELGGGVVVPDSFTWSVQFFGTDDGVGESAGVNIYSPPTVGGNYLEYWDNAGSFDWQYRTITVDGTNVPASFGALVEAVPEPSACLLGLLSGLAILGWNQWSRRR